MATACQPTSPTSIGEAEKRWIIPLSDVEVADELVNEVTDALLSGWWSMGPRVEAFESEFAGFCGAEHCFAVTNGTAALHLALLAVGCGPGDEVVLTSLNFVAAANVILHTGATPVFCDISSPNDLNMSPVDLERAITPATRAVVVLHYGGHPSPMEEILDIASRHGLAVVEDAAHATGARWHGQPCGSIGRAGCFSFFSNKNLPIGEGGMVVTRDEEVAARIRLLRSHGMSTLTWERHRGHAHTYDVSSQGFNYRMDELHAAIGQLQLRRLKERNTRRAQIVALYRDALDGVHGLAMPFAPTGDTDAAHHLAVLLLPPGRSRDEFRVRVGKHGVQTSVHYPPIHKFSLYHELGLRRSLPVTDAVASRIATLPLYPTMTDVEAELVVDSVLTSI